MARFEVVAECSLRTADVARFTKALERRAPKTFVEHQLSLDLCTPLVVGREGAKTHLRILVRAFVEEPVASTEADIQKAAADCLRATALFSKIDIEDWVPTAGDFAA